MQAVIFIGIQGAGKSTFYKTHFFNTHVRINLDMLHTRHRESLLFHTCLKAKQPFVIDNTNPAPVDRARYITEAQNAHFTIIGYFFVTTVEDALNRNARREGKDRLPDVAILSAAKKLIRPSYEEGFDELYTVKLDEQGDFDVRGWV